MWIVQIALRRPYTFIVAALLILLATPLALRKMPVDVFPEIDIPVVAIMLSYNGLTAKEMSERCGYPVEHDMGYPCPGSFGTKYGVEGNLEVITLESPYLVADERGWLECRSALRWCVDLPE